MKRIAKVRTSPRGRKCKEEDAAVKEDAPGKFLVFFCGKWCRARGLSEYLYIKYKSKPYPVKIVNLNR
jgi:hypothetical protein